MRYHDFHLREYRVSDFGRCITLDLVFEYAGRPKEESLIQFSNVSLYNFTHTGGAIITDIEETDPAGLLGEMNATLSDWNRQYGVGGWQDSLESYLRFLSSGGYKAWRIDAAVGFSGFVVAQSVRQVAPNTSLERTREG